MKYRILILLSVMLIPVLEICAARGRGGRSSGRGGVSRGGMRSPGISGGARSAGVSRGSPGRSYGQMPGVRNRAAQLPAGQMARPATGTRPLARADAGMRSRYPTTALTPSKSSLSGTREAAQFNARSDAPVRDLHTFRGAPRAGFTDFDRGVNRQFWDRGFNGRDWRYLFNNYFPYAMGVFPFLYYDEYGAYPDVYYDYYQQYGEYPQPIENYDQYGAQELSWPEESHQPQDAGQGQENGQPYEGDQPQESDQNDMPGNNGAQHLNPNGSATVKKESGPIMIFA